MDQVERIEATRSRELAGYARLTSPMHALAWLASLTPRERYHASAQLRAHALDPRGRFGVTTPQWDVANTASQMWTSMHARVCELRAHGFAWDEVWDRFED